MTKRRITIATRESPLALQQAEWVKTRLEVQYPHLKVDFLGITTLGDKMLDIKLDEVGGKGLFVKELEVALLDGRADCAVHSVKDVPMEFPPGLALPIICEREDPRDVLVSNQYRSLGEMLGNARIGTSSLRRLTQLKALRSDLHIDQLRGNINTRLKRLDDGDFDALILAAAGLRRLGLAERIRNYFSVAEILPAAGQGALGIECKEDNELIQELLAPLNHVPTHSCITAERALCRHLGGGCSVPIAAFATLHHGQLTLNALVANRDGQRILRVRHVGDAKNAEGIGIRAAEELKQKGAEKILREFT